MKKEFNLSEKIKINYETISHHNKDGDRDADNILVNDVEEAVKLLKEKVELMRRADQGWITRKAILKSIDKIFGDELNGI